MKLTTKLEQARVPVTLLHIDDRINLGNIDEFVGKAQALFDEGVRDLIIDLTDVPSITSAGLRGILTIYKLYNSKGSSSSPLIDQDIASGISHLRIVNPVKEVRRVLKLVGYDRYLGIYENLQDALKAF